MANNGENRICFVIAPIGEEGSETRVRSDQVLQHIITPAAEVRGYEVVRADKISEPGIITSQIIQHLVEDPLVIADLSDRNPNVYYELAVRHAVRKPVVQMIQAGQTIPFDIAATRTIQFDHHDLDSVARCKDEITQQIDSVERDPTQVDTPISVAIDLQSLRQSDNPLEKSNAEIISRLQELRSMVGDIGPQVRTTWTLDADATDGLYDLARFMHQLHRSFDAIRYEEDRDKLKRQLDESIYFLNRMSHTVRELVRALPIPPKLMDEIAAHLLRIEQGG
jgi:hypothetical protein